MGSFSWLKADNLTQTANVVYGKPFKFLIPKEFGGGFIKDYYQDYGYLGKKEDGTPKHDMYEILAFWNADAKLFVEGRIGDRLKYDGELPAMKEIDKYTDDNRFLGIRLGCLDKNIDLLKYPLKLVSASYTGTYEECEGRSYGDPAQGFYPLTRKEAQKIMEEREKYDPYSE